MTLGLEEPHPLRYLQLDRINEIFGKQEIKMPSEVKMIQKSYHVGFILSLHALMVNCGWRQIVFLYVFCLNLEHSSILAHFLI